jgi:2-C-methyl-D-erythritol 4-phosphate cytidylyltransferase
MSIAVLIPAGGSSVRFGANKLLAILRGKSVLHRSIEAFIDRPDVERVIVATTATRVEVAHPKLHVCAGGANRAESVRRALDAVPASTEFVAIHDAARPLVSQELISRVIDAARTNGAAGPAMAVSLTIKRAATSLPATVEATVPRANLWAMQTPQVMRRADLARAFDSCPIPLDQVTDDLQLLELIGLPATLVSGEERNLKLTTPLDLRLAEMLLQSPSPPAGEG